MSLLLTVAIKRRNTWRRHEATPWHRSRFRLSRFTSCNLDSIKQDRVSRKSVKSAFSSRQIAYGSIHFRLMHHSELYETTPTATTSQPTRNMRFRSHQEDDSILNVRGVYDAIWRTGDVALFAPSPFKPRQGCLSVCAIS